MADTTENSSVTADDIHKYISLILARKSLDDSVVTYRGHSDRKFELLPSVFRTKKLEESEHIFLREIISIRPDEFRSDSSALEILVRLQHYALPTRLLDVSFNPLVALYFAAQTHRRREARKNILADGEVVILNIDRDRAKYFDSDSISVVANLARLSHEQRASIEFPGDPDEIVKFNSQKPIKRLVHFIRQEKFGFEPEISPIDLISIFLVKPKLNNKRINAQAGAFFVFGLYKKFTELNYEGVNIERIRIPHASKSSILADLDKLGINEKNLFPDIDRVAKYLVGATTAADTI